MVVRIRYRIPAHRALGRELALLVATLLTPVALMAWALGAWRLASDLGWAGSFVVSDGAFSRWQVWIALAVALQFASFTLHRFAADTDGVESSRIPERP